MNTYSANFASYCNRFASVDFESVTEMLDAVCKYSDERHSQLKNIDSKAPIANIVLGYSGNGKSTYIRKNAKKGDIILSMDETVREVCNQKPSKKEYGKILIEAFGKKIHLAATTKVTIWLDGLWLNIMTRMALITTLHEYGYSVRVHSLLSEEYVKVCQAARIKDECLRVYGKNYTNVQYTAMKKYITEYLENEKTTRQVEEQIRGKYMQIHADQYIII